METANSSRSTLGIAHELDTMVEINLHSFMRNITSWQYSGLLTTKSINTLILELNAVLEGFLKRMDAANSSI